MSDRRGNSTVLKLTISGVTRPVSFWAEISGIAGLTIRKRLKRGMPAAEAVFGPAATRRTDQTLLAIFSEAWGGAG